MINGRFYFKQTANGNLLGEYSNQISLHNTTESCNLSGNSNEPFVGEYNSTWFEQGNQQPVSMRLLIDHKINTFGRIYTITWFDGNTVIFNGEGFLVDDLLIGNYWDTEVGNAIWLG